MGMKNTLLAVVLLSLAACGGRGGHRNDPVGPRWEKLGSRMVNFHGDHDAIAAGLQGAFRAIRIDVDRADLEMWDIKVHFANGEVFDLAIRHDFREGSWSRVIDLPGHERIISRVDFWYRTAHRGEGRANIDLWGLH